VVAVVMETAIVIVEDAVVTALTATVVMTSLNATTTVRTTKNHTNVHQVKRKQDLLSEIRVRDKQCLTDHKEWSVFFEIYLEKNRNSS
jgi:hypothetical protein